MKKNITKFVWLVLFLLILWFMKLSFINMSFLIVITLSMIIDLLPEKIFYFPADFLFFILSKPGILDKRNNFKDCAWGAWRK